MTGFCGYGVPVFLLHEIINSMRTGWLCRGFSEATPAPRCLQPLCYFPPSGWVWAPGGEEHALSRKCCQCRVPALMEMTGGSQRGLLPVEGCVGAVPCRAPSSPGAPTGPQLPLSRGQEPLASCGGVPLPGSGQQPRCVCLHSRVRALKEPCWAS